MSKKEQRCFLVQVFQKLDLSNVDDLAYIYSIWPSAKREGACRYIELLSHLTNKGELDGTNIHDFMSYLSCIGRADLHKEVEDYLKKLGTFFSLH